MPGGGHISNDARMKAELRVEAHNRHPGVAHEMKRLMWRRRRRRGRQRLRLWYDSLDLNGATA